MYSIKIFTSFSAAHFLRNYKGKCEALHGHNWKVEVNVASNILNSAGMVMDFSELKQISNAVLEKLDHTQINELAYFQQHNASSEEIARYIFDQLKGAIRQRNCVLQSVSVWETDNCCAMYSEG